MKILIGAGIVLLIVAVRLLDTSGEIARGRVIGRVSREEPRVQEDREQTLQVGGLQRTFLVHVPRSYDGKTAMPVLFALHGGRATGRGMNTLTGFNGLAEEKGFIVVYPDGVDKFWNDGRATAKHKEVDDVGFISALIDHLGQTYNVDRRRVFVTGISNGALMSMHLACDLSEKIAAIASVAGAIPVDIAPQCKPHHPMPVLMIHGTSDPIVPYTGGEIFAFGGRAQGGRVLSVKETAVKWAAHNKCATTSQRTELPDTDQRDGTRVNREVFSGCQQNAEVIVYTIVDGGHTWPGGPQYLPERIIGKTTRDINGSEIIWDFFSSKSLK